MARQARLAASGLAHHVLLRGNAMQEVFKDDADRREFLAALQEAAAKHAVAVHAYALLDAEVHLLVTPEQGPALSSLIQAIGRRYVARFNLRHGRSGTLWEGRFRAAVVEPGQHSLNSLCAIDNMTAALGADDEGVAPPTAPDPLRCSAAHHLGLRRDGFLAELPAYWQLGNTPFAREAAYGRMLQAGLASAQVEAMVQAARRGKVIGSAAFVAQLSEQMSRPLHVRPRGRPRMAVRAGQVKAGTHG